jgi:signal transduction histidine kinase
LRKALGSGGGTGLRLALAKEISYLMKAGITINSKEEGADFIFQYTLQYHKMPMYLLPNNG